MLQKYGKVRHRVPWTSSSLKVFYLNLRFLTGGPWIGSRGSVKIHESKELDLFKPLLQKFSGPSKAHFYSLGVRGNLFDF